MKHLIETTKPRLSSGLPAGWSDASRILHDVLVAVCCKYRLRMHCAIHQKIQKQPVGAK